jgi:nitric oxide dioxygenase
VLIYLINFFINKQIHMITAEQKKLVKSIVPFLRENGVSLTKHFYQRMFDYNPELKHVFNMGNQKNDKQQTALAMAVLAYAENIDDPGVLMPVLDGIGQKHVSVGIRAEHYGIVGGHLLAAIAEVVGEGATGELMDAWAVAYWQLADLMSGHEASLYRDRTSQKGGWTGWRPFKVVRKVQESSEITSFYLHPTDGGRPADFKPGQYISLRLFLPELNLLQPRQYSLSTAPNGEYYRISVKRESAVNPDLNGMVSNRLHDHVGPGDVVQVSAPSGNFVLRGNNRPIVFISGGVGQTPLMAMMESLLNNGRHEGITWIHGCKGSNTHAFKDAHDSWQADNGLNRHIFYDRLDDQQKGEGYYQGWVDLSALNNALDTGADYYLCGPKPFIEKHFNTLKDIGVDPSSIFFEQFGPQSLQLN